MKRTQCANVVLMIKPVNFFYNSETALSNVFQKKPEDSINEIKNMVLTEFDNAVELLRNEGLLVDVINPDKMLNIPDQVFPNNWFQVTHDGKLILFPMQSENRRKERRGRGRKREESKRGRQRRQEQTTTQQQPKQTKQTDMMLGTGGWGWRFKRI